EKQPRVELGYRLEQLFDAAGKKRGGLPGTPSLERIEPRDRVLRRERDEPVHRVGRKQRRTPGAEGVDQLVHRPSTIRSRPARSSVTWTPSYPAASSS